MKYIVAPVFDDPQALEDMASNKRLSSADIIQKEKHELLKAYHNYYSRKGNVNLVQPIVISKDLKQKLLLHYKSPPKILDVIATIRDELSPNVCSMCGSFHASSVDHVFPKEHYPEFSILIKNLVPACACNSLRKDIYKGKRGERILHPYYDKVCSQRIVSAKFKGNFLSPEILLEIIYNGNECKRAVNFHVNNVIAKTNIDNWMISQWSILLRRFRILIPELPNKVVSIRDMDWAISAALKRTDDEFSSLNNWKSILFSGLNSDATMKSLFVTHVNAIISGKLNPADL